LLWQLTNRDRRDRSNLLSFLMKHNQMHLDRLEAVVDRPDPSGRVKYVPRPKRVSRFVAPEDEPQAEVAEETLAKMIASMTPKVHDFLTREPQHLLGIKGRRLDPLTVTEWELGWHPHQRRIAIPIRDEAGKLVSISGRSFDEDSRGPKYLHSPFKRDRVLFGEHRRDPAVRSGFLFEGFFQTIYSWQNGYINVLARMGTHLSRQQTEKLMKWFDHLTIVPDGDKAGLESAQQIESDLKQNLDVTVVGMVKGKDADSLASPVLISLLGPRNSY